MSVEGLKNDEFGREELPPELKAKLEALVGGVEDADEGVDATAQAEAAAEKARARVERMEEMLARFLVKGERLMDLAFMAAERDMREDPNQKLQDTVKALELTLRIKRFEREISLIDSGVFED